MVRLNYSPIAGSSVPLSITFRDNFGNYYVPQEIKYTFVALNKDEQSWRIIDNINKKSITPATNVSILLKNVQIYTNTTPIRKVLIEWVALVDDMETKFVEEIYFEVQPQPVIDGLTDESSRELEQWITFNINKLNNDVVEIKADLVELKEYVDRYLPTGEDGSKYVTENYINTKLQTKADKSYVDEKIANLEADNPYGAQYESDGYASMTITQNEYVTDEEKEESYEEYGPYVFDDPSHFVIAKMEAHDYQSYSDVSAFKYVLEHLSKLQKLSDKFDISFHIGNNNPFKSQSSTVSSLLRSVQSKRVYIKGTAGTSGELNGDILIYVDIYEVSCGSGTYRMFNRLKSETVAVADKKYLKRDVSPLSPLKYNDYSVDNLTNGTHTLKFTNGLFVIE